jgi:hypothetical protein
VLEIKFASSFLTIECYFETNYSSLKRLYSPKATKFKKRALNKDNSLGNNVTNGTHKGGWL